MYYFTNIHKKGVLLQHQAASLKHKQRKAWFWRALHRQSVR